MSSAQRKVSELSSRIGEVLHYLWDPIGIAGVVMARDEYDAYILPVLAQLQDSASAESVADLLTRIEDQRMGLTPNRERALQAAVVAVDWFEQFGTIRHDA